MEFFILYGVYNNQPMTWTSRAKNRGEVYKSCIENGVHLTHLDQLTEEEYDICAKAIKDRNLQVKPQGKIITLDS